MNAPKGVSINFGSQAHLITIAPTRSGKGRDVIIPAILSDQVEACIIYDPKAENACVTARHRRTRQRRVVIINPFNIHGTRLGAPARYNPMASLDPKSPSFEADCDSVARTMNPLVGREPHWPQAAAELCSGLVMFVRKYCKPEEQHLGTVRSIIAGPPALFQAAIKQAMETGDLPIMERVSRFDDMDLSDREARSIISTAKTNTAFLSIKPIRASLSRSDLSFVELRKDLITTIYLATPGEYAHVCQPYNRLIMESAMRELMHHPEGRQVTLLIDEMPTLKNMEVLETVIGMGAGLNIRTWCFLQDIHQLKKLYPDSWQSFLANAGGQQWFAPRDEETAEFLSKRCGQRTMMVKNTSTREISGEEAQKGFTGLSHSYAPHPRALYLPQEIMAMSKNRQLLFMDGVDNVIVAERRSYKDRPELAGRYDPNPYHAKR